MVWCLLLIVCLRYHVSIARRWLREHDTTCDTTCLSGTRIADAGRGVHHVGRQLLASHSLHMP